LLLFCLQDKATALADSPGSQFASDCDALIAEGRFQVLLNKLLAQSDILFSRAQDKGAFLLLMSAYIMCNFACMLLKSRVAPQSLGCPGGHDINDAITVLIDRLAV
jgi:hypothetical protein